MLVTGKDKEEYLHGTVMIPDETDSKFGVSKSENSMIMSQLIRSMLLKISDDFTTYDTTTEIWAAAKEMYIKQDNSLTFMKQKLIFMK